jgi:recombination protein RecA
MMRLGSAPTIAALPAIPTGSLCLDAALGIGGMPRGRITEIYGSEASGKTTLALHIVAEAQKARGTAAFIDAEHALDACYAQRLGVDTNALLIAQPDTGEQALDIVEILVHSGTLDVVVIDSVAALMPKAELEGDMRYLPIGLQARLMSQGLRKLGAIVGKSRTSVIFLNQLRQTLNPALGHLERPAGGNALALYASLRLDVRRLHEVKQHESAIGNRVRIRIVKNKLAPPFRQAEFNVLYGQGISRPDELLDLAMAQRLVSKTGAWFTYHGTRMGQSREEVRHFLQTSSGLAALLEATLRQQLGLPLLADTSMKPTP